MSVGCQNGAETPGVLCRDLAQKRMGQERGGIWTAGLRNRDTVLPGEMELTELSCLLPHSQNAPPTSY